MLRIICKYIFNPSVAKKEELQAFFILFFCFLFCSDEIITEKQPVASRALQMSVPSHRHDTHAHVREHTHTHTHARAHETHALSPIHTLPRGTVKIHKGRSVSKK